MFFLTDNKTKKEEEENVNRNKYLIYHRFHFYKKKGRNIPPTLKVSLQSYSILLSALTFIVEI
jgi:hypothetical protein